MKNISKETYKLMKELISEYENDNNKTIKQLPYIESYVITKDLKYNPKYGDDKICECGHPYYRHFDSYEQMDTVGCKYCQCYEFKEKK